MTNILLLTSLIAILSQSLTKVMDHAREEYLYQYSVFVLEASASRRLTYYFPPLNLIPLIFFRPLRLCTSSEQLRNARIVLLRVTHLPYVAAIWTYESAIRCWSDRRDQWLDRAGAPKRSLLASHISFSHKASKYSAMRNRSEASLTAKTPRSAGHTHQAKDLDTMAELKKVLEKLSTQEEMIEKLSRQVETLIMQQNEQTLSPKAEVDA
ncbi:MAG: hypothetical protein LQ352_005147 [Teloschistes flavicans]|nr:MAG: hypothetical protein LQ352_005147 [Teloschistes flavicans]